MITISEVQKIEARPVCCKFDILGICTSVT